MPGLDLSLVEHRLILEPNVKPIKQKLRCLNPKAALKIKDKVDKLHQAKFIRVVLYPKWVANIVPVSKKDGSEDDYMDDTFEESNYLEDIHDSCEMETSLPKEVIDLADQQNVDEIVACAEQSIPSVGMCFHSESEVRLFYNNFAHKVGFGIAKIHGKKDENGRQRKIDPMSKRVLDINDQAGIRASKSFNSLVIKAGGYDCISYEEKDARNYLSRSRLARLGGGDAQGAFAQVFPESRHRLCLWHIMKKLPEKLGSFKNYDEIKKQMKSIVYESLTPGDFDTNSQQMIKEYGMSENVWLSSLSNDHSRWVPIYVKETF
ncbi:hypothetical protein QJS04_geneDACA014993 [Acorus gramineus]|uniref:Protein FAR1-RELATED SEQUENCE n=1 Tax=Acorus gramineus TaxID=55184 RepID=A0AAV9AMI1_ACOGR|nr:hypothetical protein QJS04_geneDACA014993 [Acorus gramineus]